MGRLIDASQRFGTAWVLSNLADSERRADEVIRRAGEHDRPIDKLNQFREVAERIAKMNAGMAAAWLVGKHRAQIRETGEMRFHIPTDAKLPAWFARAIGVLGKRRGWLVTETKSNGGRTGNYTIRWTGWRGQPHR